jgi:hypothetical protein
MPAQDADGVTTASYPANVSAKPRTIGVHAAR